jgi:hypothetical protein
MEHYYGFSMIPLEPKGKHDAIISASILVGIMCILLGAVLLRIMTDRRIKETDRRQQQMDIDFPDRRSGHDRRTKSRT